MIRAATISDIVPILRIDRDDPNAVRKALGMGAEGILVPHINTAEEVEEVVKAAKFQPRGERGIGTLCFSGSWETVRAADWLAWSHEEQLIGIMIEDHRAISHLDKIMAVKELDYTLLGPSDFRVDRLPGEVNHPKVMDALVKTVKAVDRYGKYVCIGVGYPLVENAKKFIDVACHMIELGHGVTILGTIWRRNGEEVRKLR